MVAVQLQDKVALVTGGSRGIGKGIVLSFARAGAKVFFTYRASRAQAERVVAEAEAQGGQAAAFQSDASNYQAAEQVLADVLARESRLDILVNNAGITKDNLLLRMTEEMWDEVMRINLKSCYNMVRASVRTFMKQRQGSIINISSVVGLHGNAGQANYAASKAGMIGFTKSVAQELGSRNIRCNAVAPGFITTEMTKKLDESLVQDWLKRVSIRRMGSVEDVANCCAFLASDASAYITGQVIAVDGGM